MRLFAIEGRGKGDNAREGVGPVGSLKTSGRFAFVSTSEPAPRQALKTAEATCEDTFVQQASRLSSEREEEKTCSFT